MSYLLMIPAFLCVVGIAMLYYAYTRFDGVESMVLSTVSIIGVMFLAGKIHNFTAGTVVLCVVAVAGLLIFLFGRQLKIAPKDKKRLPFFSPGFAMIACVFLYGLVAFYDEFIQNYDELQQWAAQVQYMYNTNILPDINSQFSGAINMPYSSALFQLFFQKITGYSESNMYTASFMLVWTGFALCVHKCKWRDWQRVALFFVLIFVSMFSLYVYPYKCLYVDICTATWALGLCSWWSQEERGERARKWILPVSMLVCVALFKWLAGPLIAVFVLFYFVIQQLCEKGFKHCIRAYWGWAVGGIVVAVIAAIIFVRVVQNQSNAVVNTIDWESLKAILTMGNEKVRITFIGMVNAIVGKPLSTVSSLQVYILPLTIMVTVLLAVCRHFSDYKYFRSVIMPQALAVPLGLIAYCVALYICFIAIFPYTECVNISSINRYFSIYAVLIYGLMASTLVNNCDDAETIGVKAKEGFQKLRAGLSRGILCVMVVIFAFGINENFVWKASSLCSESVPLYSVVNTVRDATKEVSKYIGENDRVYLIAQKSRNNSVSEAANYYMGKKVSGDREVLWQFSKEGANIGLNLYTDLSFDDISYFAKLGNFTHLWIYNSNRYLDREFPKYAKFDQYAEGGLYKISYDDADGLVLNLVTVIKLKNYEPAEK